MSIYIEDNGIGMKPEDHAIIFEKFKQIESSLSRKYPGSGIGLAIVKSLVEVHGGNIRVESAPGNQVWYLHQLCHSLRAIGSLGRLDSQRVDSGLQVFVVFIGRQPYQIPLIAFIVVIVNPVIDNGRDLCVRFAYTEVQFVLHMAK